MTIHDEFTAPGWTIELESGWDDDGWTRVPTNITRDTSLSWKAKGLVAFLAGHTRGFRITREFIIGASSDGETSVRSGLKELRDAGYLVYRRGQGNNGAYVLRRFPSSAQPCGKPPMVVSTHVGNHGQKKTKFQVDQVEEDQENTSSPDGDGALVLDFARDVERAQLAAVADQAPAGAGKRAVDRVLDEEFDGTFWPAYPRKVGKEAARTAYRRARRNGVTVDQLMVGLSRFVQEKAHTEARFIAHASTWLNAGRWADEPDPVRATPGGTQPYRDDDYWK